MQIKLFTIPVLGGDSLNEELNRFLRSHKVLHVEQELISISKEAFWCFSIKYLEGIASKSKPKIDYREVLPPEVFARYAALREIRKQLAKEEDVPAYAILKNEEMAELAKLNPLTLEGMRQIKGIGEVRIKKYGTRLMLIEANPTNPNEKG